MNQKETVKQIFKKALEAHHPSKLIENQLTFGENTVRIGEEEWEAGRDAIYVIAVGKASRPMARSLKKETGITASHILCISPDQTPAESYCIPSSHPVPDQQSVAAGEKLINFIEKIPVRSVVLFALSGGASALVCKPVEGIGIDEINTLNGMLLKSGANIEEINRVRKHVSIIKGGQLLSHLNPECTLIDLVISDVPSDNLEIIGSGLTTPDSSTFQDACDTLLRYDLWERCPDSIRHYMGKGLTGEAPETIKPGHDPLRDHHSYIIGSAQKFAEKAAQAAHNYGYQPRVADRSYNKSVEEVANDIVKKLKKKRRDSGKPTTLVFYGESTVEVTGPGKGGRNQELALRGALQISGMENVTWLSAGTDGIDGPTDAAGAIVNGKTIQEATEKGIDAEEFIKHNDSYHFHEQMGTLLKTGPTGNNVMDIVIVVLN